ncbi:hemerythrin domain-containing protein [Hyalangium minutum]|uniref:Hemerythrin-like domain-containing protein n=1 Tax=Hyalangium minutum TaxID=394096 RepID=A0A085WKZ3_9BACT|nr:hemerythrin domain-containing protein [Hyalangium minutum]KFE68356.1 hypothetical protein DB31_7593 [Hyalangium minutum]
MSTPSTPPRYDFYSPIHKGLRRTMSRLLERMGSANFADAAQSSAILGELRVLLEACSHHIKHENTFIHPTIEERLKGASSKTAQEHEGHRKELAELQHQADALQQAPEQARPALAHTLYLSFSRFVGENLAHMAEEEQELMGKLHAHFSDAELMAMEGKILSTIAPDLMMTFMTMMIPAMNRDERAAVLGGMKQAAPPEAFNAVLQVAARPNLDTADWQDLTRKLGVSA